ncbi:MAG: DUF4416 family protein [Pirellulales bacterium]
MGLPTPSLAVLPLLAAFSRYGEALDWAREQAEAAWGLLDAASPRFEFAETDYYTAEMGPGLLKQFFVFAPSNRWPERLAAVKRQTNDWEQAYANLGRHPEPRPLNLDPGYLTLAKLVLASTKDHAHRIYLADGIYAEVTLHRKHGRWQATEWTFPDYRRSEYHDFFSACRERLRPGREERHA